MTSIDSFVTQQRERMLGELHDLLRIPSVSTDPAHAADCRKAAEWLADNLRGLGCPRVDLLADETHPVVWAEGPKRSGKPTVLVYGHYDVQPPDPIDLWESAPFEPSVRNGNIYARGATDDKGQVFSIIKAFEAVSNTNGPPVNIRFMIEGQEESGGSVISKLLQREPKRAAADAVLVSDMPYYAPGWPAINVGLRGICYAEITVRTAKSDLHSGLYGGVAPNAHEALVRILAMLKLPSGKVRIPGLYEAVARPSKSEREGWDQLPFNTRNYLRDEVGARRLTGLSRYSVFERLWALPTFEIHGITGGFTGEGAKTVIPAVAKAKLSLRLVPNQKVKRVQQQLARAVRAAAPSYAEVKIEFVHGGDPVLLDVSAPPFDVLGDAFEEVEGRRPVPIRSGGSIPIVPALAQGGSPVLLSGIGLPDDGLHAPNEKIAVDQFLKGIRVFGRFFEGMGR